MLSVIIAAHGELASALLGSAAMICGENPQFSAVPFMPGDGPEDLMDRYRRIIDAQQPDAVLFMVDLFGGSPYNAAARLADGSPHMDIATGVNLPMLLEVSMALQDDAGLEQLVDIALKTAAGSVRTFTGKSIIPVANQEDNTPPVKSRRAGRPTEGHMKIPLVRIDSRLIHGQVATSWAKAVNCDAIFAISDEVAKDDMRSRLLLQVAPPNVKSYVITVEKAVKVWHNPMYADRSILWLVTKPSDIVRLIEGGVKISEVNVGGMSHHEGSVMISQAVAVDEEDAAAFRRLDAMGVKLTIQQLASSTPEPLMPKLADIHF